MKTENMLLLGVLGYVGYKMYQSRQNNAAMMIAAASSPVVTSATDSASADAVVMSAPSPTAAPDPTQASVAMLVGTQNDTSTIDTADAQSAATDANDTGTSSYIKDRGRRMDSSWSYGGQSLMGIDRMKAAMMPARVGPSIYPGYVGVPAKPRVAMAMRPGTVGPSIYPGYVGVPANRMITRRR